jgi:hypothetical protein
MFKGAGSVVEAFKRLHIFYTGTSHNVYFYQFLCATYAYKTAGLIFIGLYRFSELFLYRK